MYANVVMGVEMHHFDTILSEYKKGKQYAFDTDMTAEDWQAIIGACLFSCVWCVGCACSG
jgi:pyruvate, orthophosphate dikinase